MSITKDVLGKGFPNRKRGQSAQKKEPVISSDPLIDEALAGESTQYTAPEPAAEAQPVSPAGDQSAGGMDASHAQATESQSPDPEATHLAGGGSAPWKEGGDDFGLQVEAPPAPKAHPRKRQFIAGGAMLAVMVIAAIGYMGINQAHIQNEMQSRKFVAPTVANSGQETHQTVKTTVVTHHQKAIPTPAAASLNPSVISQEMGSGTTVSPAQAGASQYLPQKGADENMGNPPPASSGEQAYLRWAESQVRGNHTATREPTIPTSALSDQPPSGPGLGGQNYSAPAGGTNQGSFESYNLAPSYHRPAIPLTIEGQAKQEPASRPAWAHAPAEQNAATLDVQAYVIHHTPRAPFRVLRITERGGVPYAFVTDGPVDTGQWVQFDHHYGNGWIVGKINARNDDVQFTSPQGFVVTESLQ